MKPVNTYLGAEPLRVSRVGSINADNSSFDSVIFQQGKSLLDFDLNVAQTVLKNMIEGLAKSILNGSGFLNQITSGTIVYDSSAQNITIQPLSVNILGRILRISGVDGSSIQYGFGNSSDPVATNTNKFIWLEVWYQEIVPTSTIEAINPSILTSSEKKDSTIYQYGGKDNTSLTLTNTLLDINFGAETTRRIQLRWRLRATSVSSLQDGFLLGTSDNSNEAVQATGGRLTPPITSDSKVFSFFRSNNYVLNNGDNTVLGASSMRNSLKDFVTQNDPHIFIAGRGTSADALLLNTVDGRVYGLPIGYISSTGIVSISANIVGISVSGATTSSTGGFGNINISGGSISSSSELSIQGSSLSLASTGPNSKITASSLELKNSGTAVSPILSFFANSGTGLFYGNSSLKFSVSGSEKMALSSTGLSVLGNISATNSGSVIYIGNASTSGLTAGTSMITSLNAPTFSSSSVSITGGTIVANNLGTAGTQITGEWNGSAGGIEANAKLGIAISGKEYSPVGSSTYTIPSTPILGTLVNKKQINFIPGTNTDITASTTDSAINITITSGTSSFATAGSTSNPVSTPSVPGDTWNEGTSSQPARRDHTHFREKFPTAGTALGPSPVDLSTVIGASLSGTNITVARGDHTHSLPSYFSSTAIGLGASGGIISAEATGLDVYGIGSSTSATLVVRDTTNASSVGGKIFFSGKKYNSTTTYQAFGSIYSGRYSNSNDGYVSIAANNTSGSLVDVMRFYPNASVVISSTSGDFMQQTNSGSLLVENSVTSKYFSANGFLAATGVTFGASRFLGAVSSKPTATTNILAGDYVIDTTGNIHVYSSANGWLTAGIVTTNANTWTGIQSFGNNVAYSSLGTNKTSGLNISGYTITLSGNQTTSPSNTANSIYIGKPTFSGAFALSEAVTVEVDGAPTRATNGSLPLSAALRIKTSAITSGSTESSSSAYGILVTPPTKAASVFGIKSQTIDATGSTFAYGIYSEAPTSATNNYALFTSGKTTFSGTTGFRSTGTGAFDMVFANTENLTADRTITFKINDSARTVDFGGNVILASSLTTSGAYALTLTQTAATNVTLPTTGTLATLAGTETFTNKTLGASSTWNGNVITGAYGGTGVNNGSSTITLGGNLITSGAFALTLTQTAATNVTLPTTGTLATLAGSETFTNKTLGSGSTWNGNIITGQYGGTGVANTGKTITLGGNLTTLGAFALTLTQTAATTVTLPTTGTLATLAGSETFTNKTLGSGSTWNGSVITGAYGGTGVNNGSNTITLGGNLTTSGAFALTLTQTAATNVTLPTIGTLATLDGTETFTNKTLGASSTWNGNVITGAYGGTGVNNGSSTITLGGNLTTSGAFALTLTQTAATTVTLPTTGTLATLAGTETFSNKTFTGNVGIGTNNPSTTLEINGALTIGNNSGIVLNDSSDTLYTMANYTNIIYNQISGNDFFRIQTGTKSLGTSAIVNNNGYVEISTADDSSEPIWVSQYNVTSEYTTGTAYQSGNTITGIGTTWTASMVGNEFYYVGTYGKYRGGTITGFTSATSITVDTNQTVGSVSSPSTYKIGGPFGKRTRRAAILDESGNTYFPGAMYGGAAPRCFIPAASFTSTSATMSAEANTGQFQYSFAGGNTAFVFLVVPSNYSGAACSYTIHGTNPGNLSVVYGTTTSPATTFTSGTTTLSASTGYYFKLTCATGASAVLTGMSMVFG